MNADEFVFDQLSNAAKDRARDAYRNVDVRNEWWDAVYEDAVTVAAMLGIDINIVSRKTTNGHVYNETDISFSGFCSQGDGCCFSGYLKIDDLKNCVAALKTHVGEGTDEELFALAARGEAIYQRVVTRLVELRLLGEYEDGDAAPDGEVSLEDILHITGTERSYSTAVSSDTSIEMEKLLDEYVANFASWIYKQLEAEHDYLTSDDHLDQWLSDSEKKFDEDGNEV